MIATDFAWIVFAAYIAVALGVPTGLWIASRIFHIELRWRRP